MRLAVTGLVLSFCISEVALSDGAAVVVDPKAKAAAGHLERGLKELARVPSLGTDAERLQALDRALLSLRRARTATAKGTEKGQGDAFDLARREVEIENGLLAALSGQAEIYLARKSLPLAKERTLEALAIRPLDARACAIAESILEAEEADLFDKSAGAPAIQRIRERRAASGLPTRDRGMSARR